MLFREREGGCVWVEWGEVTIFCISDWIAPKSTETEKV